MMISSKGRYALRVMIDLTQHAGEGSISLKAIAERQEISLKYLENIVAVLNKAGLLISQRGKEGGYQLARPAQDYTVAEIVKLTEGSLAPVACLECAENTCAKADACLTLPMWQQLDTLIDWYLSRISIADLVAGRIPPALQNLVPSSAEN